MQTTVTALRVNISFMWHGRGQRIRERREALGLSQIDLAQRVGVSHVSVGNWERKDDLEITGTNLRALSAALGRSEAWILGDAPEIDVGIADIRGRYAADDFQLLHKLHPEAFEWMLFMADALKTGRFNQADFQLLKLLATRLLSKAA